MKGHPVTIIGGGLSGLILGIQLRRHDVPVILYESKSYPHHRVCGEFISGLPDGLLESLGIEDVFSDARRHRETGWFDPEGNVFHRLTLPQPALGLSRYQTDARLAQRFTRLGGELRHQRFIGSRERAGIVDATGRGEGHSGIGKFLGLKCHFQGLDMEMDLEMHLGRGAYVGLSSVEAGAVNVCGLFPRLPVASVGNGESHRLIAHLRAAGLNHLAQRLLRASPVAGSLCGTVHFVPGRQRKSRRVMAIGDALQQIPPFTGHGMAMAIESAAFATHPLISCASGMLSWEEAVRVIDRDLIRACRLRLGVARSLHPFLRRGWLPGLWKRLPLGRDYSTEKLTGWLWGLSPEKALP